MFIKKISKNINVLQKLAKDESMLKGKTFFKKKNTKR